MARTKKKTAEALEFYLSEIKRLYPSSTVEVSVDTIEGTDGWIEVYVPERSVVAAAGKFARLENKIDDEYGVRFVTLTMPRNGKAAA
jgi:hypothetical protein